MRVFLDEKELDKDLAKLNKQELLDEVQNELEDSIIEKIYLDDEKVNCSYFRSQELKINIYDKIKFVSKKTNKLINETLLEARDYLPKLKEGLPEIFCLISRKERVLDGNKFFLALEGFEWYSGVLNNIKSLIDDKELKEKTEKELEKFNEIIQKALKKQQNDEQEQLAEMFSGEILDIVDEFISLNEKLISRD